MASISAKTVVVLLFLYCVWPASSQGFGQPCQLLGVIRTASRCVASSVSCAAPAPLLTCSSGFHCCLLNSDIIPDSLDWRDYGVVTPVKDQGSCNASWAFSVAAAVESYHAIKTGNLVNLSVQQLIDCDTSNNGCAGGNPDTAFLYAQANGLMSWDDYPYTNMQQACRYNAVNVTARIDKNLVQVNETAMMNALVKLGPIVVPLKGAVMRAYEEATSVLPEWQNNEPNPAALYVAYKNQDGEKYWIIKSSLGTSFGEEGYIRIKMGAGILNV